MNQPVTLTERHLLLDVLRGFALLGVLLANMVSHAAYFLLSDAGREALGTTQIDHYVEWVEHFLIDGKFYSLFSMLFGIGFALQMQRSSGVGRDFTFRFVRRLIIMLVIGILHAVLLFVGDILTVYALLGFVLLLFRKSSDKTLIRTAMVMLLLPVIQYGIFWGLNLVHPQAPVSAEAILENEAFFKHVIKVFQSGSYPEIIEMNIGGLVIGRYPDLVFTGRFFRVFAMFLIGFYVARNMIYANVNTNRTFIRKAMIWGAVIGVPCNIVLAMMMATDAYYDLQPMGIIQPVVYAFGVPALCIFYVSAIALAFENPVWRKRWMIFAPVGQMALTNYLMQSVLCCFVFMSYGLGLAAKLGPAKLTLIALAIYVIQMIYSHIWLKYFRFGPMEWLWRSLTYRKMQPFRRREL